MMAILAAILVTLTVGGADSDNYQIVRGKLTGFNSTKDEHGTYTSVSVRHDKGTIVLTIDEKTRLEKVRAGKLLPCTIAEIAAAAPGGYVEADCDQVVFATNPPSTGALRLRLLEKREP
jgi:hypothetical protein